MHSHSTVNQAGQAACSSNNSINENRYNSEKLAKASAVYKLKKILKPIVTLLKSKSKHSSAAATAKRAMPRITSYIDEFDCDYDNSANERLEQQLISELEQCHQHAAAILVYEDQQLQVLPIEPEDEQYVPVHFARTEAGTFFWTTMPAASVGRAVDEDLIQPAHCYTEEQYAQPSYADRWAQA
ncbi:enhancer of split malpha protein-like [Anopheles bellator]|uniref:enhancer of split malpha protein-like n=1 Tax=Anopheles bellator TaxID=139047 RepID=UPI0026471B65|nr:enhancer of split malpha protein-like [Anopheles bellator]